VDQNGGKKMEAPPPPLPPPSSTYPPPTGRAAIGKSTPTLKKVVDLTVSGNNLRIETRNRGIGEGILGIPRNAVRHILLLLPLIFAHIQCLGSTSVHRSMSLSCQPTQHTLPKLDFPKFNDKNPKI
jgi:hypothetical protein